MNIFAVLVIIFGILVGRMQIIGFIEKTKKISEVKRVNEEERKKGEELLQYFKTNPIDVRKIFGEMYFIFGGAIKNYSREMDISSIRSNLS